MTPEQTAEAVAALLRETLPVGFELFGFCPLQGLGELLPVRGRERVQALADAGGWAILFAVPYAVRTPASGNVARYAWPDDYHVLLPALLAPAAGALRRAFPEAEILAPTADTTPLPEVRAAVLAGLGFRGRSGRLITPQWGSEVFLCEIVTGLRLAPLRPPVRRNCGKCERCLAACPTGALTQGGLDRSLCLSHITQKKGKLTAWEQEMIRRSGCAWGCDRCADACPYNQNLPDTPAAAFRENLCPMVRAEELDALLRRKSYGWRGAAVMRRNLALLSGGGDAAGGAKD